MTVSVTAPALPTTSLTFWSSLNFLLWPCSRMPWNTCLLPSVTDIQLRPAGGRHATVTPSGTSATSELRRLGRRGWLGGLARLDALGRGRHAGDQPGGGLARLVRAADDLPRRPGRRPARARRPSRRSSWDRAARPGAWSRSRRPRVAPGCGRDVGGVELGRAAGPDRARRCGRSCRCGRARRRRRRTGGSRRPRWPRPGCAGSGWSRRPDGRQPGLEACLDQRSRRCSPTAPSFVADPCPVARRTRSSYAEGAMSTKGDDLVTHGECAHSRDGDTQKSPPAPWTLPTEPRATPRGG